MTLLLLSTVFPDEHKLVEISYFYLIGIIFKRCFLGEAYFFIYFLESQLDELSPRFFFFYLNVFQEWLTTLLLLHNLISSCLPTISVLLIAAF